MLPVLEPQTTAHTNIGSEEANGPWYHQLTAIGGTSFTMHHNPSPCGTTLRHLSPSFTICYHSSPCVTILRHSSPCGTPLRHLSPSFTICHHSSPCVTILHHLSPPVHVPWHHQLMATGETDFTILHHPSPFFAIL